MTLFKRIALALALTLALPTAAFGAAATQTRTESLLVIPSITLTGLPSTTLVWNASTSNSTVNDVPSPISVSTDAPAGYTINTTHAPLTSVSPPANIPISAQKLKITTAVVAADLVVNATHLNVFGTVSGAGSIVDVTCGPLCAAATSGTQLYQFTEQIVIPVGQTPATYTGTLVYAALSL